MFLRTMLAEAYLLVRRPMPNKSRVMTQTKRDTLVLHVAGVGRGVDDDIPKKCSVEEVLNWKLEGSFGRV
jgi:hypothetical protein